jgi:beta-lactamase class A
MLYKIFIFFIIILCTFISFNVNAVSSSLRQEIIALESKYKGKISFAAINTTNNTTLKYNANIYVPMCSTYKFIVVAAILKKSMMDSHFLQQKIQYKKEDLVTYSPITSKNLANGMTIAELCKSAILSDNTAANLLVKELGGITVVNNFARSIGNRSFRLDRLEPYLNSAIPGDLRDTTTAFDMMKSLQTLVLGSILGMNEKLQLQDWLKNHTTGNERIRAGIPKHWSVGDKTGTCKYGSTNDIGIIWPKNCSPIVLSIYFTRNQKNTPHCNEVIANTTSLIIDEFAKNDICIHQQRVSID